MGGSAHPDGSGPLSIYDLAREVGVSYGTVSRALNGRPDVSEATRARVLAAASRLGYRPNPVARSLARNVTTSVGIVVPGMSDPFFVHFARGVQAVADGAGYGVMTSFADDSPGSAVKALADFAHYQIAGVLVLGGSSEFDSEFERYFRPSSIVTALRRSQDDRFSSIWVDHAAGARQMVDHLVSTGRENIAFVSLPIGSDASKQRLDGYRAAMRMHGIEDAISVHRATGMGNAEGSSATRALLAEVEHRPDAIFYASDALAIGGLHALSDEGIDVPGVMSVAGFGDIASAEYSSPSLTTVELSFEEVGRRAMTMLLKSVEDPSTAPESYEMPFTVVQRRSTAAARSRG